MDDLVCNYKKCRNRLSAFAWVTSCSHVFCDDDGSREFNKSYSCPACETSLSGKFDIVRIDMNPNEQYKSMVLVGQRPEIIMEIASRALAFWSYQSQQERTYQEYMANKNKERTNQLEQYYEQILTRTQTEIKSLKVQIAASKKELDGLKKRFSEISDKLMERNRQYQKLQSMYDALRRRNINASSFDNVAKEMPPRQMSGQFDFPIATGESVLGLPVRDRSRSSYTPTRPEKNFFLQPMSSSQHNTPVLGGGGDNADASLLQRFNMDIGTPNEISRRLAGKK